MRHTDIAIVGGGLAGATAAAMLGRAGVDAVLIDPRAVHPPEFRCEKLDGSQIQLLEKTGLADAVFRVATRTDGLWVARFGRLLDKKPNDQCDILYDTLVNTIRAEIPQSVGFIQSKAAEISTGSNRQRITSSTGEEVSARLVVLAAGLNTGLHDTLGIEREVLSRCHSISIGFDLKPVGRDAFEFPALTYFPERTSDQLAYLTLFPIGPTMRANLFVYRHMRDPWLRRLREEPEETLFALMPGLVKLTGDVEFAGRIKIRPVDLYLAKQHKQPGIVLVGDAFSTSCPAAGTGASKVFTDVERLCNVHIPKWLASEGMGEEKIAAFYDDAVRNACHADCLDKAFGLRSISVEPGLSWQARRWVKFLGHLGLGVVRRGRRRRARGTQVVVGGEGSPGRGLRGNAAPIVGIAGDLTGLKALEADWRALFAESRADNYFVSYDWCKIWWDAFGESSGAEPAVVSVRRAGRLVALLPLAVWRTGPLSTAEGMGGETGQYSDLLIAPHAASDQAIFNALWEGIRAAGIDQIQFTNVRDDSALARLLAPLKTIQSEPIFSCGLDTRRHQDFDAYMKTRSASLRKNMRRRRRKLEALGPVTFETITDPDALDEISRTLVDHKRDWLADRGLYGRFLSRTQIAAWMADVARAALKTGNLHLSLLRVGGRIASAQLGFICGGKMTGYFTSFDLEYSSYAVGRMQTQGCIDQLFDRGLQIDLMPPEDDYKLEWVDRHVAARAYTAPVTRLGTVASHLYNSRNRSAIKKMYLSLPHGLRSRVAAAGLRTASGLRKSLSRGLADPMEASVDGPPGTLSHVAEGCEAPAGAEEAAAQPPRIAESLKSSGRAEGETRSELEALETIATNS